MQASDLDGEERERKDERFKSAGRVFEPLRFADAQSTTLFPDPAEQSGFAAFLTQYQTALKAERAVVK